MFCVFLLNSIKIDINFGNDLYPFGGGDTPGIWRPSKLIVAAQRTRSDSHAVCLALGVGGDFEVHFAVCDRCVTCDDNFNTGETIKKLSGLNTRLTCLSLFESTKINRLIAITVIILINR